LNCEKKVAAFSGRVGRTHAPQLPSAANCLSPQPVPRSVISVEQTRSVGLSGALDWRAASSHTNWHATCM